MVRVRLNYMLLSKQRFLRLRQRAVMTLTRPVRWSVFATISFATLASAHAFIGEDLRRNSPAQIVSACPTITVTNPSDSSPSPVDVPFSRQFTQSGGVEPVTFTMETGTLATGLSLGTDGTLSGTPTQTGTFYPSVRATDSSGCFGIGTAYRLIIGGPLINNFFPNEGEPRDIIHISGYSFISPSVSFNGIHASLDHVSDNDIYAIVPAGATTGPISVTTSGGTATTSTAFTVIVRSARTFVSTAGLDTNPCTRTAPCRDFDRALDVTTYAGEIIALTSGNYAQMRISRPVSITVPTSVHAVITGRSPELDETLITIGAGPVSLRGLTLDGVGRFLNGINMVSSGTFVELDRVVIANATVGIDTFGAERVHMHDSTIRGCGTGFFASGSADVIENSRIEPTGQGLSVYAGHVVMSSTQLQGNQTGVIAQNAAVEVTLQRCAVTGGTTGILARDSALVRLSRSTISGNTTDISTATGGSVVSFGNNTIDTATPPVIPLK
jgi:copper-binding protein NosD